MSETLKVIYIETPQDVFVLSINLGEFCLDRVNGFDLLVCKKNLSEIIAQNQNLFKVKEIEIPNIVDEKEFLYKFRSMARSFIEMFGDKTFLENLKERIYDL